MNELEEYYGKFCEDKRLTRRHGQVEFRTSMKYIHDYLKPGDKILDSSQQYRQSLSGNCLRFI